ncbi:putative RNA-directed DNA polymerase [Tanacetum coccineum]
MSSHESNEPCDDGGDYANISNKFAPNKSTNEPRVNIVDSAAREKDNTQPKTLVSMSNSDSVDVTGSTSSRKDTEKENTCLNDDDYMSEGKDLGSFGHLFGWSPKPAACQTVRRSSRKYVLLYKYNAYVLNKNVKFGIDKVINYANLSLDNHIFTTSLNKIHEPTTYLEAVKDSRWVDAINQEMEALNKNKTSEIVDLPSNRRAGRKWVFKVKYKASGDIEIFKARLVAKGFNQRKELIMMRHSLLWSKLLLSDGMQMVKSLYGLKQTPRKWNEKLVSVLSDNFFMQSMNDFSLFIKNDKDVILALLVYVDDIIVTRNNSEEITKFKQFLSTKFLIKDLGKLKYFLGIEVLDVDDGICLTQMKYCTELHSEFGMLACKPYSTPVEANPENKKVISKFGDDEALTGITHYQKLVGKIIYLTMTRPDISYAVHCLSQVMHSPMKSHLRLALRVLRYLKREHGLGITFRKSNNVDLKVFFDSDWAKCKVTRRYVTRYCVFMENSLVSWKSKKRVMVSRSSSEAEYRAMCNVCCKVMWIKKVLTDLHVDISLPVEMNCDNSSAIQISANPILHERSKHFEIDLYFLREKVEAPCVLFKSSLSCMGM